jgi:hypothetical protein
MRTEMVCRYKGEVLNAEYSSVIKLYYFTH